MSGSSTISKEMMGTVLSGLVLAKILYFSTGLASVGWNRFQTLYFLNQGIPPGQIGELKSIGLALKFIGEPFWCFIADMTDPKIVFILSLFASIGSLEILRNTENVTYWTVVLVKLVRTATAPQATLTIIASMELIKGSQEGYGQQRLYGSLAWGMGAYVVGMLIDTYGTNSMFYFTYFFQFISLAIVLRYLPTRPTGEADKSAIDGGMGGGGNSPDKRGGRGGTLMSSIGTAGDMCGKAVSKLEMYVQELKGFFRNRCCRVILVNALTYGVVMQTCDTYLYIAVEEDYHANKAYSGLCVMASTLSCIPIFYYSKKVILLYGHSNMIMFSHVSLVVRLCLLSTIRPENPFGMYLILMVQLMHGFNYALFWSASVDAIFNQSPKHLGTSCMATLNLFYQALGFGIGSLAWGYIYEYFGGMNGAYYALAIISSILASMFFYTQKTYIDVAMNEKANSDDGQDERESLIVPSTHGLATGPYRDDGNNNGGAHHHHHHHSNGHRDHNKAEVEETSERDGLYGGGGASARHPHEGTISQQRKHSSDFDFRV